jgi:hypothetical protein
MNAMKTVLIVFSLLCATAALGQAVSGAPSLSSGLTFASHDQRASQHDMGQSQNVMEQSEYFHGHGERPLAELAPVLHETPLGDSARIQKEVHAKDKKSTIVWTD